MRERSSVVDKTGDVAAGVDDGGALVVVHETNGIEQAALRIFGMIVKP